MSETAARLGPAAERLIRMPGRGTGDRLPVRLEAGPRIPGWTPRVALVVLGAAAYLVVPVVPATIVSLLVLAGALLPTPVTVWGGILVLGLGQLANPAVPTDGRLYAALALAHLLHLGASLTSGIDPRGALQTRVLIRPLRRWLLVQVPAQACLAAVLLAGAALPSGIPVAPIAAAVGAGLVVLIAIRAARR